MIANATEYQKAQDELRSLEQRLARLQQDHAPGPHVAPTMCCAPIPNPLLFSTMPKQHQIALIDTLDLKDEVVVADEAEEILPFKYSITSYGADYPVDSLVKRMAKNDIIVPPF